MALRVMPATERHDVIRGIPAARAPGRHMIRVRDDRPVNSNIACLVSFISEIGAATDTGQATYEGEELFIDDSILLPKVHNDTLAEKFPPFGGVLRIIL